MPDDTQDAVRWRDAHLVRQHELLWKVKAHTRMCPEAAYRAAVAADLEPAAALQWAQRTGHPLATMLAALRAAMLTQRLRGCRGHSRAVTAVGHSILTAAWHMLHNGELYRDLGGDYFTRQNPDRLTRRLVRQLEPLGHQVTLTPKNEPEEIAA
jgi:hypothetical protein